MVLRSSDYSIPSPGSQYDPLNLGTYKRLIGFAVVATALLFVWRFSQNRLYPTLNTLMSNVGLSAEGGSLEVFN